MEHPERGQGVDGDGGGVFHGHVAADLVPHALVLDDVRLPCPCETQLISAEKNGDGGGDPEKQYQMRPGMV